MHHFKEANKSKFFSLLFLETVPPANIHTTFTPYILLLENHMCNLSKLADLSVFPGTLCVRSQALIPFPLVSGSISLANTDTTGAPFSLEFEPYTCCGSICEFWFFFPGKLNCNSKAQVLPTFFPVIDASYYQYLFSSSVSLCFTTFELWIWQYGAFSVTSLA